MKQIKAWGPALLWMGVIYLMSAMPGEVSGARSGSIVEAVYTALCCVPGVQSVLSIDTLHFLVRKGAHMAEYAILFWLYLYALRKSGAKRPGIIALMLCAAYAATDEFHQRFVAGRGPSIVDVGIDTLGAALAWGAQSLVRSTIKKRAA